MADLVTGDQVPWYPRWISPFAAASAGFRRAINGLIAQRTGVRKRPFSPPFHQPTGIIPSKLNGFRLPPGRFRFLVDLDSGGFLYLMPAASAFIRSR